MNVEATMHNAQLGTILGATLNNPLIGRDIVLIRDQFL